MASDINVKLKLKDEFSGGMKSGMGKAKIGLAAVGTAAIAAGAAILKLTNDMANYNDKIGKAAAKTGLTTETLSGLKHALELSGGEANSAEKAMTVFATKVGRAQDGFGTAKKALDTLGISVKDANGNFKSQDQLLDEVADGLEGMEDGANKTLVATQLFSKEAGTMLNATRDGARGLKEMAAEADSMGLIVTGNAAAVSAAFNDMKDRLEKSVFGVLKNFADQIMPTMTAAVEMLKDAFMDLGSESGSGIDQLASVINKHLLPALANGIYYGKVIFSTFALVGQFFRGGFTLAISTVKLAFKQLMYQMQMTWEQAKTLAKAIKQAASGEFKAALQTAKEMTEIAPKYAKKIQKAQSEWVKTNVESANKSRAAWDNYTNGIVEADQKREEMLAKAKQTAEQLKSATVAPVGGGQGAGNEMREAGKINQVEKKKEDPVVEEKKEQQEKINEIEEQAMEDRIAMHRREQEMKLQSSREFTSGFIALTKVGAKKHKGLMVASKGLMVAQAVMDTYAGANRAMGAYPPPFGQIAAAGVIAAGLANVAQIKTQKFNEGGIVTGVNAGRADMIPVRANPREMILTTGDQKELLNVARGKRGGMSEQPQINYSPSLTIQGDGDAPNVRRFLNENLEEFKSFVHTTMRQDTNVPAYRG